MTKYTCVHCGNKLSTKSSLRYHQKSARYCLELRGISSDNFKCKFCPKSFSQKQHLCDHAKICGRTEAYQEIENKNRVLENKVECYEKQIEDLKNQVHELQDKLENIAIQSNNRPTTTNQTQVNNYIKL